MTGAMTAGAHCAYCLTEVADPLACAACGASYHRDCWDEAQRCAVPGCASTTVNPLGTATEDGGSPRAPVEPAEELSRPEESPDEVGAVDSTVELSRPEESPDEDGAVEPSSKGSDQDPIPATEAEAPVAAAPWSSEEESRRDGLQPADKPAVTPVNAVAAGESRDSELVDAPPAVLGDPPSAPDMKGASARRRALVVGVTILTLAVAGAAGLRWWPRDDAAVDLAATEVDVAPPSPTPSQPETIPMPDVVDMHVDDVAEVLTSVGIRRFQRQESAVQPGEAPAGTVVGQSPRAGTAVDPHDVEVLLRIAVIQEPTPEPSPTPTPTPTSDPEQASVASRPEPPPPPPPPAQPPISYAYARTTISHPDGPAIASTFEQWATGINYGDYWLAFSTYTSRLQNNVSYTEFEQGNLTSIIEDVAIHGITGTGSNRTVHATMVSLQDPAYGYHGQSCSIWQMEYGMVRSADTWYINSVREVTGGPDPC